VTDNAPGSEPGPDAAGGSDAGAETGEALGGTSDEWFGGPVRGVGPHPQPWPDDPRLDPELLEHGDSRNVVDRFRYWTVESIVADLDTTRFGYHVAIENFAHDMNIGTVVRNANAFGAAAVHIVGRRRWNRRGAMVTDRYVHLHHHPDATSLAAFARAEGLVLVGIDNIEGSVPLESSPLPLRCVLVFGQEGRGLTDDALAVCDEVRDIPMFGSTRSINAGVASGVAMSAWVRHHGGGASPGP
jgi:tRNA G18 (ribose-2'-O)-methylase SpoU